MIERRPGYIHRSYCCPCYLKVCLLNPVFLFDLFDPNISIPDPFGLILKTDIANRRSCFEVFRLADVHVDDVFAVELDLQVVSDEGDDVAVPLPGWLDHILGWCLCADDAAAIVMADVLLAIGVQNLHLKAAVDMIGKVAYPQENAGIAFFIKLEFQVQNEITIHAFGRQVITVPLPSLFAGARDQRHNVAVFDHPVAGGLPSRQIFSVEHLNEVITLCIWLRTRNQEETQGACSSQNDIGDQTVTVKLHFYTSKNHGGLLKHQQLYSLANLDLLEKTTYIVLE